LERASGVCNDLVNQSVFFRLHRGHNKIALHVFSTFSTDWLLCWARSPLITVRMRRNFLGVDINIGGLAGKPDIHG